jgi:multiple sugar transport system substrate-binding protein
MVIMTPVYAKGEADNRFNFWYCQPVEYNGLMSELIAEFNKSNPHCTIVARNFRTPNELYVTLKEGKETPDLAIIDASWQEELVSRGSIVPVEDQMLKIAQSIKVVAKMDTFKPLWKSCVADEKLWTMPYYGVNHALMYNPEHFKNKVITKPPVTWGEIVDLGKKLTDPATGVWGFYIPFSMSSKDLAYLYQIFLWQAGGIMENPQDLKVAYNSEFGQKALQFWVDAIHKHKIAPSRSVTDMSKVGMMVGTTKDILDASKKGVSFKVVAWPIKNKDVGDIEVSSIAIFKNSPQRLEKMWHFTYWLTEFPQGIRWSLATHYLPANKQVTLSPGYFEYKQKNPGIVTFLALLEKGCAKPGMKDWDYESIMADLGEKIAEALTGRLTVQDALDKAALRANSLIREEAGRHKTSSMK